MRCRLLTWPSTLQQEWDTCLFLYREADSGGTVASNSTQHALTGHANETFSNKLRERQGHWEKVCGVCSHRVPLVLPKINTVSRDLPCNAGDVDLIPGQRTNKIPHAAEQLCLQY